jgi:hypothetical protein
MFTIRQAVALVADRLEQVARLADGKVLPVRAMVAEPLMAVRASSVHG